MGYEKKYLKKMHHGEVLEDTWMNQKHDWLDYVKNDVLCPAVAYTI